MDSHMEELKDIPTKTQKRETTEQLLPVRMKPIMGIEEIMEELEPSMSIDEKKALYPISQRRRFLLSLQEIPEYT